MNRRLIALATGVLLANAGYAQDTNSSPTQDIPRVDDRARINQTPSYRDNMLSLPSSVAVGEEDDLSLYRNIRFSLNEAGGFDVVSAEPQSMAAIERVYTTTGPGAAQVNLVIVGELSSGCMKAGSPVLLHQADQEQDQNQNQGQDRGRIRVVVGESDALAPPTIGVGMDAAGPGGGGTGTGGTGAGGTGGGAVSAANEASDCLLGPAPFATATQVPLDEVADGEYRFGPGGMDGEGNDDAPGFGWMDGEAGPRQGDDPGGALGDGEILQVLRVINDGEIAQSQLALDSASSEDVRTTAQMIIADHGVANAEIDRVSSLTEGLEDSDLSEFIQMHAMAAEHRLADLDGERFDCAYLQVQAGQHMMALNLATGLLQPEAESEEVRALLMEVTPDLAEHLRSARQGLRENDCAELLTSSNGEDAETGGADTGTGTGTGTDTGAGAGTGTTGSGVTN